MFYSEYLNEEEISLLEDNYSIDVLNNIDNFNAIKIIEILKKYEVSCFNDLIINYIEIFMLNPKKLDIKLSLLKEELGNDFIAYIENNLNVLID